MAIKMDKISKITGNTAEGDDAKEDGDDNSQEDNVSD